MKIRLSSLTTLFSVIAGAAATLSPDTALALRKGSHCSVSCLYSECSISCSDSNASCTCDANSAKCTCGGAAGGAIATARFPDSVGASQLHASNLSGLIAHFEASNSAEGARIAELAQDMLDSLNAQDAVVYQRTSQALVDTVKASSAQTIVDYLNYSATLPQPTECGPAELDVNVGVDGQVDGKVGCSTIGGGGSASLAVLAGLLFVLRRRRARA